MEQRQRDIEGLQRTHGYNEEEAEVVYHLMVAQDRLAAIYKRKFEGGPPGSIPGVRAGMSRMAFVEPHFRALFAVLDRWVLERDYPDRLRRPHSGADEEGSG